MLKEIRKNPMYPFLLILVLTAMMGFQGWRTLLNNFAVEKAGINGLEIGIVQSFRELPGLMVFLVVYVMMVIREHKLASLSLILMGGGIALTGYFPDFIGLTLTTILMSVGFHYFETTNKSLTLQHFNEKQSPIVMAQLRSFGALGNIVIGAIVWFLSGYVSYKISFLLIGLFVVGSGIVTIFMRPVKKEAIPQQKKLILKKKYWLFYVLNLLSGARRQIFIVFAVFLLVEKYHYSVKEIVVLFVLNNVISYFVNPVIGKSINLFGERKVLSFEYIGLFIVFSGYVFIDNRMIIGVLYLIDHIFFNFAIGINTYLQKIADPEDIAPSTAVGFAINHLTAVIIPVVGGLLWVYNYKIPFIAGAFLAILSLYFVQKIKLKQINDEILNPKVSVL
ncbi:MAG: MFS transporter [Bacteroidales bacterium]|nr:MFS transporter [Bacteroidales bacterium]